MRKGLKYGNQTIFWLLWWAWMESFFSKWHHQVVENTRNAVYMVSQNTMVLGVYLPFVFIIPTIQSSCFNISILPTLLIDSRRLHLFGLTNNLTGSFMASSLITVFSVSLSAVPVRANKGIPTIKQNNNEYTTILTTGQRTEVLWRVREAKRFQSTYEISQIFQ